MRRLVLVGAGHAHARVLLELAKRSMANLEVLLISPVAQAPYSGMVPGWLAGHYRWEECCIDFSHLCRRAGASLRMDAVAGIDPQRKELLLASWARIPYDWLSVNIGSTLTAPDSGRLAVLPLRPLAAAHARWHALLDKLRPLDAGAAYRVLMVGGGAAGVESVLAAHRRLTQWAPQVALQFVLATQDDTILPGMATGAARKLRQHLASRGIAVVYRLSAERFEQQSVVSR
jgi:NADH dehydrogenase FAD-containing subunit